MLDIAFVRWTGILVWLWAPYDRMTKTICLVLAEMTMFCLPLCLTQLLAKCTPQCLWSSTKHILWKLDCYTMLPDVFLPWDTDHLREFNLSFYDTDDSELKERRNWILFTLFSKLRKRKRLWKPPAASSSIGRKFPIMTTTRWRSMTGFQLCIF